MPRPTNMPHVSININFFLFLIFFFASLDSEFSFFFRWILFLCISATAWADQVRVCCTFDCRLLFYFFHAISVVPNEKLSLFWLELVSFSSPHTHTPVVHSVSLWKWFFAIVYSSNTLIISLGIVCMLMFSIFFGYLFDSLRRLHEDRA